MAVRIHPGLFSMGLLHRRPRPHALRPALAVALAVALALLGFGAVSHVHDHDQDCAGRPAACFWCLAAAALVVVPAACLALDLPLRAALRLPAPAGRRAASFPVGLRPGRAPPAA